MRTEEKIIENYTDIPALLKNCGARRPFLCCGKSFEKTDAFAYLQAHCRLTVWDTVRPNPRYEDMVAAAELYRKEGCDFIIGAGGGSPLDRQNDQAADHQPGCGGLRCRTAGQ